jgi:subtilisin-like proprotein convertase family protein
MISTLLEPRLLDQDAGGFTNWNLTSAQFWGEQPVGQWRLYFANVVQGNGRVASCSLTFYGFK